MSNTPITDANLWVGINGCFKTKNTGGKGYVPELIARELETKLVVANDRINRLEDGDAELTYSIGLDLQKENEALKAHIKRLEEAGDALKAAGYFGGFGDAVNKWNKSKEDKP